MFVYAGSMNAPESTTFLSPTLGCNDPIVGKGVVVDHLAGSLVSALGGASELDVLIDGDLTDYITFNGADLISLGAVSLVSVKDAANTYAGGQRTGYVIEAEGGLLGADVLNDLEIRTYLNNQLQETAQVGGGGSPISLSVLAGAGSRRRVDFLTTLPFDEVELRLTGVANLSLISALRIYYAYEEVDGCDYNCATALTTANYPSATASTDCELFIGLCLEDGFDDFENSVNPDTTDYAFDSYLLAESHYLDIDIGEDVPANYEVGFAVEQLGLLGLLSLDVLGGIIIETYDDGVMVESFVANASLANVALLPNGASLISVPTTQAFDRVRITITSVLNLLTTYRIYYGFVRPDADADGFPDCVDQCLTGDDNFDADGDGTPDDCDMDCALNAGPDISGCTDATTLTLFAAGMGESWAAAAGNPSPASIDAAGVIMGLANEGDYAFVLSDGLCTDTVIVAYYEAQGMAGCNDPFAGPGVLINDNGSCSLCGNADANNVIDGDLSNFVEDNTLLTLSISGGDTKLFSVRDTLREYAAGTRVGYVVTFPSGLVSLDLLDVFALQTYNDGVPAELLGAGSGNLLDIDGLGTGEQQRLSFVATQTFDEVELVVQGGIASLDLLTTIRIFYAFTEPDSCPDINTINDITDLCGIPLTASSSYCAEIIYERSGFAGVACVGCSLDSLSNLVDDDLTQPATIDLLAAALGDVSLSVSSVNNIVAGTRAGFAIALESSLLDVGLLDDIVISTYAGGILQESVITSNPLVSANLLNNGTDLTYLSFVTTQAFDEIQITFDAGLAGVSALGGTISVYYAYIQFDSDGDGVPDCLDQCCEGPDTADADGDGDPDACDVMIQAASDDDVEGMLNTPVDILFLANDDFGDNGAGVIPPIIEMEPIAGVAVIDENGTPGMFTDDFMTYTPDMDYLGMDSLCYRICDANFSCDSAWVRINIIQPAFVTLDLKVMLLGAVWPDLSGTSLMRDNLRADDYIPLDQPYGAGLGDRFAHFLGGTEQTTNIILDSNAGTGDAIVDWVFVELRDAADSTNLLITVAGLLQRDGDIVSATGGPIQLVGIPDEFYVTIKHRNHLGVMTAAPVTAVGGVATVDFTTISTADLWNEPGYDGLELYTLMDGSKALWSGNANVDIKVKYDGSANDRQTALLEVVTFDDNMEMELNYNNALGYFQGDCNMDGKVKYDGANNDRSVIQAVVVLLYDLNTENANNYNNMIEQVPAIETP